MKTTRRQTMLLIGLLAMAIGSKAQVPTGIDPGSGDPSVSIWQNPTYIVVVVLVLAFVILGFWIRRRR